jgi:hypothetical protein
MMAVTGVNDQQLMEGIRAKYGAFIAAAVKGTAYPAAFVAALVANESGLDEQASRFEPGDFWQLAFVLIGRSAAHDRAAFGSIGGEDLKAWIGRNPQLAEQSVLALANLATSWGPTQIMGYEAVAGKFNLAELTNLEYHFRHAVRELTQFTWRWNLEPIGSSGAAATPYFRCWNTGKPDGQTFDPAYVNKGVIRMQIYAQLEREAA